MGRTAGFDAFVHVAAERGVAGCYAEVLIGAKERGERVLVGRVRRRKKERGLWGDRNGMENS